MNQNSIEIINEFQKILIQVYKPENINSIDGLDIHYLINGENVFSAYMAAINKAELIYKTEVEEETPKFNYFKTIEDIILISREILHFTGLTLLYKPLLQNPLDNPISFTSDDVVYVNDQGIADKRYFMYATVTYEKLYNFWDRIGDLIASYFPENIKPHKVYFSKLNEFVSKEHHLNENYKWLINFKTQYFSKLNKVRKDIVHYENIDTNYIFEHMVQSSNKEQLSEIINKRNNITDELKRQIDLTLDGIVNTIRFMEYLNETELNDSVKFELKRKAVHNTK